MIPKDNLEASKYINILSQMYVKMHNGSLKMKNYEI